LRLVACEGQSCERVVGTDFVQLAPDRTVTVSPLVDDPDSFDIIIVEGLTYLGSGWTTGPAEQATLDRLNTPTTFSSFTFVDEVQPLVRPDLIQVQGH
jgi:hypothetical protein